MRVGLAILALVAVGCGGPLPSPSSSAPPASERVVTLPGRDALVPTGVASTTSWQRMNSLPNNFDEGTIHESPSELADAFGAAVFAGHTGSPQRPDLALETFEKSDGRVVLVITETGVGDDSVAGSQYALVAVPAPGGWTLSELWTRALCRRGGDAELCT